jgi:hypothetical protein
LYQRGASIVIGMFMSQRLGHVARILTRKVAELQFSGHVGEPHSAALAPQARLAGPADRNN